VPCGAEESDVANDPVAVSLLGAVGVMMVPKYLADLVHKLEAGIGPEFFFVFHDNKIIASYYGKLHHYFYILLY